MKIQIDIKKLEEATGKSFKTTQDFLNFVNKENLDYLLHHNKNYTAQQYYRIVEICDIFSSFKEV